MGRFGLTLHWLPHGIQPPLMSALQDASTSIISLSTPAVDILNRKAQQRGELPSLPSPFCGAGERNSIR